MIKVAVVILNWNGKDFLSRFLPSVLKHTSSEYSIVIADNASTDGSVDLLKRDFPSVRLIQNEENGGFARGYNQALKLVDAEYYILLNSDVEVGPGWIDPVIRIMNTDDTIGAAQPKIRSYDNREYFEYAGAAGGFIDKFGYPFCRGRILGSVEKDVDQYNDPCEIFWATGACMFVRAKLYHELGGMDEDFFAHMEEIDLCWRMKNRGHKIMYVPDSVIYHVGAGTLSRSNPQKTYLNFRNNMYLLFKNHASSFFLLKIFMRMLLDGIAAVKFLFSDGPGHWWAVARAHFSFYGNFGKVLRKRSTEKKAIKQFARSCIYRGSIVLAYYLAGKKKFSSLDRSRFI